MDDIVAAGVPKAVASAVRADVPEDVIAAELKDVRADVPEDV